MTQKPPEQSQVKEFRQHLKNRTHLTEERREEYVSNFESMKADWWREVTCALLDGDIRRFRKAERGSSIRKLTGAVARLADMIIYLIDADKTDQKDRSFVASIVHSSHLVDILDDDQIRQGIEEGWDLVNARFSDHHF